MQDLTNGKPRFKQDVQLLAKIKRNKRKKGIENEVANIDTVRIYFYIVGDINYFISFQNVLFISLFPNISEKP